MLVTVSNQEGTPLNTLIRTFKKEDIPSCREILEGIGSRRCVSENADNTHYVKLLTIVDKLFRCGGQAHNEVMPHSAFNGQTPDEIYFGTGRAIAAGSARAREARMDRIVKLDAVYASIGQVERCCNCGAPSAECVWMQHHKNRPKGYHPRLWVGSGADYSAIVGHLAGFANRTG